MKFSCVKEMDTELCSLAKMWVLGTLSSPDMTYDPLSGSLSLTLYLDNKPMTVVGGNWQVTDQRIYLSGYSQTLVPWERLAIVSCMIGGFGLATDTEVVEVLSQRVVELIGSTIVGIHSNIIGSRERPRRLAFNINTSRMAAELQGNWYYAGGVPAPVDDSWITMDF